MWFGRAGAPHGRRGGAGAAVAALCLAAGWLGATTGAVVLTQTATVGSAGASSAALCNGFAGCDALGYSTHGYATHMNASWWRADPGVNCTNYVSYVESTVYGVGTPSYLMNDAGTWPTTAGSHGVIVNKIPSVGAVAEWDHGAPGMGAPGHVAVVEAVTPANHWIRISQDNVTRAIAWTGFAWYQISATQGTSWEPYPDNFIHFVGSPPGATPAPPAPASAPTSGTDPSGYDLVGADGGVFVFDPPGASGGFFGSLPMLGVTPDRPVVGIVPTLDDGGYFLVAADGGVFSFGDAPFLGSLPGSGVTPSAPIVGIVATDTDRGYFLVGADGGVFAFGTAPYLGSLPGSGVVTNDAVGIAATPSGDGYWVVSSTGTVWAFGQARRFGTAPAWPSPVAAVAGTPSGGGYWVANADGMVTAFGDANDYGTLTRSGPWPSAPVVAIVPTPTSEGYLLIGADGGVYCFGDAGPAGSLPDDGVAVSDIVGAVPVSV